MLLRSFLAFLMVALLCWSTPDVAAQTTPNAEADRIARALAPRRTRGIGAADVDQKALGVVDRLQTVRRTRGLNLREADELHEVTQTMPQTDVEILFAFNSAVLDPQTVPQLNALGQALSRDEFKTSTIIIGGHTDGKGTPAYNQTLSDQRAQAVATYLSTTHKIDPARLLATGYGPRKLKVPNDPFAAENRRVQIVNAAR